MLYSYTHTYTLLTDIHITYAHSLMHTESPHIRRFQSKENKSTLNRGHTVNSHGNTEREERDREKEGKKKREYMTVWERDGIFGVRLHVSRALTKPVSTHPLTSWLQRWLNRQWRWYRRNVCSRCVITGWHYLQTCQDTAVYSRHWELSVEPVMSLSHWETHSEGVCVCGCV